MIKEVHQVSAVRPAGDEYGGVPMSRQTSCATALAVAKFATLAALELGGGTPDSADRAEILAIAMRVLKNLPVKEEPR